MSNMPVGIYLYEIDESFGPNVLAEYYLAQEDKVSNDALKDFEEKHVQKEFSNTIYWKEDLRYYSWRINASSLERDNLFLGFVLKQEEDLVSSKSILENIAEKVVRGFTKDSAKLESILRKEFEEKHVQKEFLNTIFWKEDLRYYSSKINASSIKRDNLFLGFVLKQDEDLVSSKSILENISEKVVNGFSEDKANLESILRKEFDSIFTLMEKLKEPALIKETINNKTKKC